MDGGSQSGGAENMCFSNAYVNVFDNTFEILSVSEQVNKATSLAGVGGIVSMPSTVYLARGDNSRGSNYVM
jgi:hypothetical protein